MQLALLGCAGLLWAAPAGAIQVQTHTQELPTDTDLHCHTAVLGEACYTAVTFAMTGGIIENPSWYPGLSPSSTFHEFQKYLHDQEAFECAEPCDERRRRVKAPEEECRAAVPGEECYRKVEWAMKEGIDNSPEWFPGLTKDSTFQDFQKFLHGKSLFACPSPCQAAARQESYEDMPALPRQTGCYVWLPDGCRLKSFQAQNQWRRDQWGEVNKDAANITASCKDRKHVFDHWCGVTNTVMVHVAAPPTPTDPLEVLAQRDEQGLDPEAARAPEAKAQDPVRIEHLPDGAPPAPSSAGCFVWLPSGCKSKEFHAKHHWKKDVWGERNLRAATSAAACGARKSAFDHWCGVEDAVMLIVGEGEAAPSVDSQGTSATAAGSKLLRAPRKAQLEAYEGGSEEAPEHPSGSGCFVWLPSGCRKEKVQSTHHWKRDRWGEAQTRAGVSAAACRVRKQDFDSYCGVQDAVMLALNLDLE